MKRVSAREVDRRFLTRPHSPLRQPAMGHFDIVFLRNVMIYFDVEAKKRILDLLHGVLAPDGWLFLGTAETTLNLDGRFARTEFGACCHRPAAAPRASQD